jgi:hypothetical protein
MKIREIERSPDVVKEERTGGRLILNAYQILVL